jgi:hypothetical protein
MKGAAIRRRRLAATTLVAAGILALVAQQEIAPPPVAASAPAAASGPAVAPAPAPMTNEDIVRLVVNGTSEAAILREIARRPPLFDLEPGVVTELENVGVGRGIIEAMRRRMLEAGPPPAAGAAAPSGAATTEDQGAVILKFAPAPKGAAPPEVFAIMARPKNAPRADDGEVGLTSELALVLICTTSTHVPDHWDTRTPLVGAPRHEMLLFRPGSRTRKERGFELLVLDRTDPEPITLPAGRHAFVAGLAGRQGSGDWRLISSDGETAEVPAGGSVTLALDARSVLRGNKMVGYGVEQIFTLSIAPSAPAETPASTDVPGPAPEPKTPPAAKPPEAAP